MFKSMSGLHSFDFFILLPICYQLVSPLRGVNGVLFKSIEKTILGCSFNYTLIAINYAQFTVTCVEVISPIPNLCSVVIL